MPLTKFLEGTVFDPETVKLMGMAFEDACRRLGLADRTDPLTAIIAGKIISAAKLGERDPRRLCEEKVVFSLLGASAAGILATLI